MQSTEIIFRNKKISHKEVKEIRKIIQTYWDRGRTYISREICQELNWRQPNGQLKDQVCRLLLLKLEEKGNIELPARKTSAHNDRRSYCRLREEVLQDVSTEPIVGRLRQIKPIELKQVRGTAQEHLWNILVYKYHYLKHKVIVGSHLKYIAFYKGEVVGCLSWGAAIWAVQCRDEYIGWGECHRRRNLRFVINNNRFLVLPWVNVKNLASHLLSINIKRLFTDWVQIYNHPIYLIETFVDPARFKGTCYKAGNWIYIGQTKGYAKRIKFYYHGQVKDVYVYPLVSSFREKLLEPA